MGLQMSILDDGPCQARVVLALQVIDGVFFVTPVAVGFVQSVDEVSLDNETGMPVLPLRDAIVEPICQRWGP